MIADTIDNCDATLLRVSYVRLYLRSLYPRAYCKDNGSKNADLGALLGFSVDSVFHAFINPSGSWRAIAGI
jgi:hypothetical protein